MIKIIDMQNYIVFDLEWNQGEAPAHNGDKTLTFEIVEIGAVKLNSKKEKIGEFSRLIKPQVHKQMHRITGRLSVRPLRAPSRSTRCRWVAPSSRMLFARATGSGS